MRQNYCTCKNSPTERDQQIAQFDPEMLPEAKTAAGAKIKIWG
jgi:hypothetical protein